jgi:hypothetical protein
LRKSEFRAIRFPNRQIALVGARGVRRGAKGVEIFLFFPPQPIEKSKIGRIEPSKSKQFYLDLLGRAWLCLALFGRRAGLRFGAPPLCERGSAGFRQMASRSKGLC